VTTADVWSEGNNDHLRYCIVDDRPTLVWIANLASIELHTLLAKASDTSRPTMMVFDFDPGPPANIIASARCSTTWASRVSRRRPAERGCTCTCR
jgi:bifunctional non-homologous end joining protein LigD